MNTAVKKREKWLHDGNKWDVIVPDREIPGNVKYIVVDVETHDWKDGHKANGRIVEIAWMVFDRDMKCLESKQYLLKPHGYDKIAQKATACHGITTELAVEYGVNAQHVFVEFTAFLNQLPDNGFVIAHKMEHEDPVFKCNLNEEQRVLWEKAPKCDTWDTKLLKYLPSSLSKEVRDNHKKQTVGVALTELYSYVCPLKDESCAKSWHMAMEDVKMTWAIFLYYVTSVSYNKIKWRNDSKVKRKSMICTEKKVQWLLNLSNFCHCSRIRINCTAV